MNSGDLVDSGFGQPPTPQKLPPPLHGDRGAESKLASFVADFQRTIGDSPLLQYLGQQIQEEEINEAIDGLQAQHPEVKLGWAMFRTCLLQQLAEGNLFFVTRHLHDSANVQSLLHLCVECSQDEHQAPHEGIDEPGVAEGVGPASMPLSSERATGEQ